MFVGTQPRLPAPFGLARNGLIAYDAGGDIYAADPVTGVVTAIVSGPETDVAPIYSRDGSQIVFERQVGDLLVQLYVVGVRRERPHAGDPGAGAPPAPADEPWQAYEFSPDGRSVLFASSEDGYPSISIAQSDGSGVRQLDVGMAAYEPSFRPPDGAEILFVGGPAGPAGRGLLRGRCRERDRPDHRRVLCPRSTWAGASWSPDGSRIAYYAWDTARHGITARTHVIAADGTGDLRAARPAGCRLECQPHVVERRNATVHRSWIHLRSSRMFDRSWSPRTAAASASRSRIQAAINGECCADFAWSPDDSTILITPTNELGVPQQQVILDPLTGASEPASWKSTSDPTWQRLAP